MATKKIIAVDIDDTLAASAQAWVAYSNQKWETNLAVDDYDEDWAKMWQVNTEVLRERADHLHTTPGITGAFKHDASAQAVLNDLAKDYELVITTSRHSLLQGETLEWLDKHFNGVFSNIHFAGIYDSGHHDPVSLTKADLIEKVGADYLIDDQAKHCFAVAEQGRQAILFGDYVWNRDVALRPGVARCRDWAAVKEYFDAQR